MRTHFLSLILSTSAVALMAEGTATGGTPVPAPETVTTNTTIESDQPTTIEGDGGLSVSTTASVNKALVPVTDETKLDAINKAMRSRESFDTPELALAKLQQAAGSTENFYGLPIAIRGFDAETQSIDPASFEGLTAVLATVGARVDNGKGAKVVGIKGIVLFAMPKTDSFAATEAGKKWLDKIVSKECGLVAFRSLRNAATLSEFTSGVDKAPGTVDEYVTEYSRGASDDAETFDALWNGMRQAIKESTPALFKLLPPKPIAEKCLRSHAYALASEYAPLEEAKVFEKLINVLIATAQNSKAKDGTPAPLPVDGLQNWLLTRDELVITDQKRTAPDFSVLGSLDF